MNFIGHKRGGKMRVMKWMPAMILLFCTACSPLIIEEAKGVSLNYWETEDSVEKPVEEYVDETDDLAIFVNAVKSAEELAEPKIITTKPLLTMHFTMEDEENRSYHLWVTEKGEGFLQSLKPLENQTLQLKETAVKDLTGFLKSKEDVQVLQGDIEFEE